MATIVMLDEVEDWLLSLSVDDYRRVIVVIQLLEGLGSRLRMPHSKSLGAGLFELRVRLGTTARRITYRFGDGGEIVLLTTFHKQKRVERLQVERARAVAADDRARRKKGI